MHALANVVVIDSFLLRDFTNCIYDVVLAWLWAMLCESVML